MQGGMKITVKADNSAEDQHSFSDLSYGGEVRCVELWPHQFCLPRNFPAAYAISDVTNHL
jgi:hypothetical protein